MKKLKILGILILMAALQACSKDSDAPAVPQPPTPSTPSTPTDDSPSIPNPDPSSRNLYNGITLPLTWPPSNSSSNVTVGMNPTYLTEKPKVIDITIGRQLFVDDFLISSTSLQRVWYQATYHAANPVLKPEKDWELNSKGGGMAAPFSDGVWYDEADNKFKMWYMASGGSYGNGNPVTCYAESSDGITWTRPSLNVVSGTNIVHSGKNRDSNTVWLDRSTTNTNEKYKMFQVSDGAGNWKYHYYTSADGKSWREQNESGSVADRSTVFQNPFRGVWVWSLRHNVRVSTDVLVRGRDYMENASAANGNKLAVADLQRFWFGAWPNEPRHPNYPNVQPAIYNLDAIGYESVLLGVFSSWAGPENDVCTKDNVIKRNQLLLGYSRDGWNWYRGDFTPFCPVNSNSGSWNFGNIQSAVGSPIIVGDKLYFYMSGRRFDSTSGNEIVSTGLATLRRDGFASMSGNGELVTESLKFSGKYFYVNANIKGSIKVELLETNGSPISGFTKDDCQAITGNGVSIRVRWKNNEDLSTLKNKNIKVKFYVENSDLYSFWISPYSTGNSFGYTAGGGPNLSSKGIDIP